MVTSEQDRGLECDLDSKAASAKESNARTHTERRRNTIYVLKCIKIENVQNHTGVFSQAGPSCMVVSVSEVVLGMIMMNKITTDTFIQKTHGASGYTQTRQSETTP